MDLTCVRAAAPELGITKIICRSAETVIQGDPDGQWTCLRLEFPWMRKLDGMVGPGQHRGINMLAEKIRGIIN